MEMPFASLFALFEALYKQYRELLRGTGTFEKENEV